MQQQLLSGLGTFESLFIEKKVLLLDVAADTLHLQQWFEQKKTAHTAFIGEVTGEKLTAFIQETEHSFMTAAYWDAVIVTPQCWTDLFSGSKSVFDLRRLLSPTGHLLVPLDANDEVAYASSYHALSSLFPQLDVFGLLPFHGHCRLRLGTDATSAVVHTKGPSNLPFNGAIWIVSGRSQQNMLPEDLTIYEVSEFHTESRHKPLQENLHVHFSQLQTTMEVVFTPTDDAVRVDHEQVLLSEMQWDSAWASDSEYWCDSEKTRPLSPRVPPRSVDAEALEASLGELSGLRFAKEDLIKSFEQLQAMRVQESLVAEERISALEEQLLSLQDQMQHLRYIHQQSIMAMRQARQLLGATAQAETEVTTESRPMLQLS